MRQPKEMPTCTMTGCRHSYDIPDCTGCYCLFRMVPDEFRKTDRWWKKRFKEHPSGQLAPPRPGDRKTRSYSIWTCRIEEPFSRLDFRLRSLPMNRKY